MADIGIGSVAVYVRQLLLENYEANAERDKYSKYGDDLGRRTEKPDQDRSQVA